MADQHEQIFWADDERPDPEGIAARIDLGDAEYHEHCCPWLMWSNDPSTFTSMPDCDCGGAEMAKGYVVAWRALRRIAAGDWPEGLSASAWADAIVKEQTDG